MEKIDEYAFFHCESITNINIPSGVKNIGAYAFSECSALEEITIPEGVTEIGEQSFSECTALKRVTLPDTLETIGLEAFFDCNDLERINIPKNVTTIGECALGQYHIDAELIYCPNFVMYCYENTAGHRYAEEVGLNYELLDKKEPVDEPAHLKADINHDGQVDVTDLMAVAAHVKGIRPLEEPDIADVNGDGDVNITDLSAIAAHVKGIRAL